MPATRDEMDFWTKEEYLKFIERQANILLCVPDSLLVRNKGR